MKVEGDSKILSPGGFVLLFGTSRVLVVVSLLLISIMCSVRPIEFVAHALAAVGQAFSSESRIWSACWNFVGVGCPRREVFFCNFFVLFRKKNLYVACLADDSNLLILKLRKQYYGQVKTINDTLVFARKQLS